MVTKGAPEMVAKTRLHCRRGAGERSAERVPHLHARGIPPLPPSSQVPPVSPTPFLLLLLLYVRCREMREQLERIYRLSYSKSKKHVRVPDLTGMCVPFFARQWILQPGDETPIQPLETRKVRILNVRLLNLY